MEIKAVNGKWKCPYCPKLLDATDGYASHYNMTEHIKDHRRQGDREQK